MHIFTRVQTAYVGPESSTVGVLWSKGYIMVDVLAPLHQHVGVGFIVPFRRTAHDLHADLSWLLKQVIWLF